MVQLVDDPRLTGDARPAGGVRPAGDARPRPVEPRRLRGIKPVRADGRYRPLVSTRRAKPLVLRLPRLDALVAVLILAGALGAVGLRLWQAAAAVPAASLSVPMTVRPGDSLWSLARRYGDPRDYILERVDRLARANRLPPGASLTPGQRLLVPVANPVEVAKLRRAVASGAAQRQ